MVAIKKSTIRDVFSGFVREIARDPKKYQNCVLFEGILTGRYIAQPETENYHLPDVGTVFYRGEDRGRHAFYFVPDIPLHRASKTNLNKIAEHISTKPPLIKSLEIIVDPGKKVLWPPESNIPFTEEVGLPEDELAGEEEDSGSALPYISNEHPWKSPIKSTAPQRKDPRRTYKIRNQKDQQEIPQKTLDAMARVRAAGLVRD